jgi:hypothetical protein
LKHNNNVVLLLSCRTLVPPCKADGLGPDTKPLQQLHALNVAAGVSTVNAAPRMH